MVRRVASAIGCTEGQVWTVFLGLVVAAVLVVGGLPALSHHPVASAEGGVPAPLGATDRSSVAPPPPAAAPGAANLVAPEVSPLDALAPAVPGEVPAPLTPFPAAVEPVSPQTAAAPAPPVRVIAAGWASASPAAGQVDDPTVPSGSLPVAARGGSVDKASFLRFSAMPGKMRLVLATGGPVTQQDDGSAAVQACVITAHQWTARENGSLSSAPSYDCAHPVVLAHQADGSFTADLGPLGPGAGANGVALLPVTGGVATFQVVFDRP